MVAQHRRARPAEDHGSLARRALAEDLLGRLAEDVRVEHAAGGRRRARQHGAHLAEGEQRAGEPAADRLVALDRLAQRHREPLRHVGRDRAVHELDAEPLGHPRADLAAAGAVRSGKRDDGHGERGTLDGMSTEVTERQAREVAEAAREREWKLPSFGKELFLGNFRLDLISPQPRLDAAAVEKGEAFLGRLRAFLEAEVDPLEIERDAKIPDRVLDGLKALGALGMKVPEEYGGLGLSQVYYNRALALTGVWHGALSTLLSAHQSIGVAEPLMLFGSEEQKRKWLPLVTRDHISAFLLTEPDVGSDPARLGATAVPTEDGSGYTLNGLKLWATNGAIADIVVVMAQVPKGEGRRGGITAFVLPYDTPGVTVEHRNAFMGLRGIENSVTRLEDVFVPRGERDRQGGPGPQDRAHDAEHRPARAARDLRRHRRSGRRRSRASSPPSACSGASRSASTTRSRRRSRSSPRAPSGWRRCSTSPAGSPTTSPTTSGSRRRSPSSTARSWAGGCSTS